MIIKNSQINIFRQQRFREFEDDMLEHIAAHFPEHNQAISELQLRATIRLAHARAAVYRLNTERSVCIYLNAMLCLGSFFDIDPLYESIAHVLNDKTINTQTARANNLSSVSVAYILQQNGDSDVWLHEAIARLVKYSNDYYARLTNAGTVIDPGIFRDLFPQKWGLIDDKTFSAVVQKGRHSAARYRINAEEYVLVYVLLMYLLGAGYDNDPQYIWASTILKDDTLAQEEKAKLLLRAAGENLGTMIK